MTDPADLVLLERLLGLDPDRPLADKAAEEAQRADPEAADKAATARRTEVVAGKRKRRIFSRRAKSFAAPNGKQRLTKEEAAEGLQLEIPAGAQRPSKRADCLAGGLNESRPCPWAGCRYHLFVDVSPSTGTLKLNFPDLGPEDMGQLPETCTLDVAAQGGATLEEVGAVINLTRERIRQVEVKALLQLQGREIGT